MSEHTCHPPRTCTCSIVGLEPAEDCPVHTGPQYPPRCAECGKFLPLPDPGPYPSRPAGLYEEIGGEG